MANSFFNFITWENRIIERVLPRLNHMNPAVVLSTIKVVLKFLVFIPNGAIADGIVKKLTPSIGTYKYFCLLSFRSINQRLKVRLEIKRIAYQ